MGLRERALGGIDEVRWDVWRVGRFMMWITTVFVCV